MHQINAKIISNRKVGPAHFKMALHAPQIARAAKPGQFIHVRCSEDVDPLLRRPFSIHRIGEQSTARLAAQAERAGENKGQIEILYKVVGRGTEILSKKKSGERLDVIGPLGNGFDLRETRDERRETKDERRETILVAGGMGVAPLLFLAEELSRVTSHPSPRPSPQRGEGKGEGNHVIIGARTKNELFCAEDFKKFGFDVHIATDDGSRGFKGLATDLLKRVLRATSHEPRATIYACGPRAMLREVAGFSRKEKIPCQVSLEENMGCGVGACLGCAVKARWKDSQGKWHIGYRRVCKEGPVFDIQQIIWS